MREAVASRGVGNPVNPATHTALEGMIQDAMFHREVVPFGHAEEFLIAGWRDCMAEFKAARNTAPVKGEIFLTFSPCREGDPLPSPRRTIDGIEYPPSCRNKLYAFFAKNRSVKWSVVYDIRFRTAGPAGDDGMPGLFPGWVIRRMTPTERATLGLAG